MECDGGVTAEKIRSLLLALLLKRGSLQTQDRCTLNQFVVWLGVRSRIV